VIYIGTFSKTLFPGLRVGYMVLPRALAGPFAPRMPTCTARGTRITQLALAELIEQGHYAAHIRRMRVLYARRRALLAGLITEHLGVGYLHPQASNAGLHLVLRLPDGCDDVAISKAPRRMACSRGRCRATTGAGVRSAGCCWAMPACRRRAHRAGVSRAAGVHPRALTRGACAARPHARPAAPPTCRCRPAA
jgi:hypothetical protein